VEELTPQLKAFVIGPIGDRDEPHGSPRREVYEDAVQVLEEVIEPACSALGLEAIRADQITRMGEIPEQIFRQIRDAHVVIADLTGANPNVMYELGLRHTTGKLTVQLGERGRLPFDVAAIRTIMFKRTDAGLVEARRSLIQALAVGLECGGDPVAATRVWFEQSTITPSDVHDSNTAPEPDDEPGFLEKLADTEDGIQALGQALTTASAITEEVSRILVDGSAKVTALEGGHGTSAAKLAVANRVAALLEDPAARLRIASIEYAQSVERIEPGLAYMLSRLANEPDQLAEAPEFPHQLQQLVSAAGGSIEGTLAFKSTIDDMGNATRSLRQVSRRLSDTLKSLADTSGRVADWQMLIDRIPTSSGPTPQLS
jgi:hypothetical protein